MEKVTRVIGGLIELTVLEAQIACVYVATGTPIRYMVYAFGAGIAACIVTGVLLSIGQHARD